jgi:ABC-type Zn uptake system ZnuABC Zn-binding protein ZnuA
MKKLIIVFIMMFLATISFADNGKIKIVCTFSDYAAIAKEIAKDKAEIEYIAVGDQDPHFVAPKPSYAMMLNKADMLITTGMDLEVWITTLIDKARNKKIIDGANGFVGVADGIKILEKVDKGDRTEGDVHLSGNPHINTSPVNWKYIAKNITIGLKKVDPANASFYEKNRDAFISKVDNAIFGEQLVKLFGGESLTEMLLNHTLFEFLENDYEGKKLSSILGGWLKETESFRGKKIIAYHKNWSYLTDFLGLEVLGYIEPKPGIPPSAKHVQYMTNLIKEQNIKLMIVASYFEKKTAVMIEDKTGIKAVYFPLFCKTVDGIDDPFKLMDYWVGQIKTNIK